MPHAEHYIQRTCDHCEAIYTPRSTSDKHCSLACVFWSKVAIKDPDECWPWTGATSLKNRSGYGVLNRKHKRLKAHHVAWQIHFGIIPKDNSSYHGMCVCHKCDNPLCCNPDHLFLGTHTDNVRDMISKQRRRTYAGEGNPAAVLNREQVFEIKDLLATGKPMTKIAKQYCIGRSTVFHIKHSQTWKNI